MSSLNDDLNYPQHVLIKYSVTIMEIDARHNSDNQCCKVETHSAGSQLTKTLMVVKYLYNLTA